MKVFVWERIEDCSGSYHSEGGVVVFAKDETRARELANEIPDCNISKDELPDYIRNVTGNGERVFIFPDAGCC